MKFYKEKLLSSGQLKRLSEHKYSSASTSLLDPLLQPWWNWLVSKVPLWLAPNLITVLGLIINIIASLILVYYSPDAKAEAPRWACLMYALSMFVYQSLDSIDGKQARRTGSSSPLGELFDHGCDSISTVFVAFATCITTQLGYYPNFMFFQCFCAMTLFYCAHWQTYVSGSLKFGKIDVTEAQVIIMSIHLLSAAFGTQVWNAEIPFIDGFQLKYLIGIVTVLATYANLYSTFSVIFTGGVGRNGSTVAGTSVLSPVIPISCVIVPAYIIYQKSAEHVYENHPALYIIAFGIVAAKVTNRLVVAQMTKSEMQYLDSSLFGIALLFLNQYFNFFIKEHYVLWLCFIYVTFDLFRYCSQVCLEICDHMKIELFRIPVRSAASQSTDKNGTNRPQRSSQRLLKKNH